MPKKKNRNRKQIVLNTLNLIAKNPLDLDEVEGDTTYEYIPPEDPIYVHLGISRDDLTHANDETVNYIRDRMNKMWLRSTTKGVKSDFDGVSVIYYGSAYDRLVEDALLKLKKHYPNTVMEAVKLVSKMRKDKKMIQQRLEASGCSVVAYVTGLYFLKKGNKYYPRAVTYFIYEGDSRCGLESTKG